MFNATNGVVNDKVSGHAEPVAKREQVAVTRSKLPLLAAAFLAVALVWPAFLNGQAFFLADTTTYVKGAATGMAKFFAGKSRWLDAEEAAPPGADGIPARTSGNSEELASSPEKKGVLAGRSVFYGAFILFSSEAAGLWVTVLLQAALAALTVMAVVDAMLGQAAKLDLLRSPMFWIVFVGGTSLPFYCSYLMPDLFAGLAILAAAALLSDPRPSFGRTLVWLTVMTFATLFHTSHIVILAGMLILFVLYDVVAQRRLTQSPVPRYVMLLLPILIGISGEFAFKYAVERSTGAPPIRPPFLTARLVADGPGADWARRHCPSANYVICNYVPILGNGGVDDFMWSADPKVGVFTLADQVTRRTLGQQDISFGAAVFLEYPVRVLLSSAKNFASQLVTFGLAEFNYDAFGLERYRMKLPQEIYSDMLNTKAAAAAFPAGSFVPVQLAALLASSVLIVIMLARLRQLVARHILRLGGFVLTGIFINALVCGVLSQPHDRYQARTVWLIPLLAALLYYSTREHMSQGRNT